MFGEAVKAHRRRLGLSQEELAEKTGVNPRTIGNIEAGRIVAPRASTVRLLAAAFNLVGADRERFCSMAIPSPDAAETPAPGTIVPRQLPLDVHGFTGRRAELGQMELMLADSTTQSAAANLVVVSGMGGVGKTALAVHWGHQARHRFPDGQLYVNMRAYSAGRPATPIDVLGQFLRALGVPAEKVPGDVDEVAALYRSVLADRRVLVVLDNVRTAEQVRPILPGSQTCFTVVTSRARLDGLGAVDGASRIDLDVLTLPNAVELLALLVGEEAINANPAAAAGLAQACGRLPLALRITAAQLARRDSQQLAAHLAALRGGDPLAALAVDEDPTSSVSSTLDLSFRTLPADAARVFRLLGLSPASELGLDAIGAFTDLPQAQAAQLIGRLRDANLVIETQPGRFGLHDLVRLYAAGLARDEESEAGRRDAVVRLLDWYTDAVVNAKLQLVPSWQVPEWQPEFPPQAPRRFVSYVEAMAWYNQEHPTLLALTRFAVDAAPQVLSLLIQGQVSYLFRTCRGNTLVEVSRLGFDLAERTGDEQSRAAHANSLGIGYSQLNRPDEAILWYQRALADYERLGDERRVSRMYVNIGAICSETNRPDEAVRNLRIGLEMMRRMGDRGGEASALLNLGYTYYMMQCFDLAESILTEARPLLREDGNQHAEFLAVGNLGATLVALGRHREAVQLLEQGIRLGKELGDPLNTARNHRALGDAHWGLGAKADARREWTHALSIFVDIESTEADQTRLRLSDAAQSPAAVLRRVSE